VTQVVDLAVTSPAPTGGSYADLSTMTGTPWEGVLALEGVETGDGREFSDNALTWDEGDLIPLRWNKVDSHGGIPQTQAVTVGRINQIYRDPAKPNYIMGRGVFDDQGVEGAEALRLVRDGFLSGVSIDSDNIKDADVELVFPESNGSEDDEDSGLFDLFQEPDKVIFHAGRIRGATLCDIPAFTEAKIWLSDPTMTAVAATNVGEHFQMLSDRQWSGPTNEARLRKNMSVAVARGAFAYVTPSVSPTAMTARFLHHEITEDGEVNHANLTACAAGIRAINSGRAETLAEAERRAAYEHLATHMRVGGMIPAAYVSSETIIASSFDNLVRPPAEWFDNPKLQAITPLTITEDGRVFGHGAIWGTCHTAFPGACTTPPIEGDHVYYRLGEVVTASGSRVAVGSITLGTGHASVRGISASQAAEHYDHTGTVVAVVASGEDDHGIWVAGAVRPGTPEARVQELRAASLSGDWRRIGGQLRLVAFLAVNRPGFPVPRTSAFVRHDAQVSLVAAGVVTQSMRRAVTTDGQRAAMLRIAKSIGRDPGSRLLELKKRMGR
jgi:hypothetical protein